MLLWFGRLWLEGGVTKTTTVVSRRFLDQDVRRLLLVLVVVVAACRVDSREESSFSVMTLVRITMARLLERTEFGFSQQETLAS